MNFLKQPSSQGLYAPGARAAGGSPAIVAALANNSGNSTITPTGSNELLVVTLGGSARTSNFILDATGRKSGDQLTVRFVPPATAAIVIDVRDTAAGGTQLYSYSTDGSGTDILVIQVYFDGANWQRLSNIVPAV